MFNNLKNLRELQMSSRDMVTKKLLECVSNRVLSRQFQTRFNIGEFIYALPDLVTAPTVPDLRSIYSFIVKMLESHEYIESRKKILFIDILRNFNESDYSNLRATLQRMEDYTCIEEMKLRSRPNLSLLNSFYITESYETKPNFIQLRKITIDYSYFKYFDFT